MSLPLDEVLSGSVPTLDLSRIRQFLYHLDVRPTHVSAHCTAEPPAIPRAVACGRFELALQWHRSRPRPYLALSDHHRRGDVGNGRNGGLAAHRFHNIASVAIAAGFIFALVTRTSLLSFVTAFAVLQAVEYAVF